MPWIGAQQPSPHTQLSMRGWLHGWWRRSHSDTRKLFWVNRFHFLPQLDRLPELPRSSHHEFNLSGFSLPDLKMTCKRQRSSKNQANPTVCHRIDKDMQCWGLRESGHWKESRGAWFTFQHRAERFSNLQLAFRVFLKAGSLWKGRKQEKTPDRRLEWKTQIGTFLRCLPWNQRHQQGGNKTEWGPPPASCWSLLVSAHLWTLQSSPLVKPCHRPPLQLYSANLFVLGPQQIIIKALPRGPLTSPLK